MAVREDKAFLKRREEVDRKRSTAHARGAVKGKRRDVVGKWHRPLVVQTSAGEVERRRAHPVSPRRRDSQVLGARGRMNRRRKGRAPAVDVSRNRRADVELHGELAGLELVR